MSLEERIDRIEKMVTKSYKLSRALRRRFNKLVKISFDNANRIEEHQKGFSLISKALVSNDKKTELNYFS